MIEEQSKRSDQEFGNLVLNDDRTSRTQTCRARVEHSRRFLEHFLHLTKVEFTIIFLVMSDVVIVMVQLVLELYACKNKLSHDIHERLETVAKAFHYLSLTFICLFVVEILLKIFALGPRFFKAKLNIADAFVVFTSLILDIVFIEEEAVQSLGTVVTALRVWRIFRIITSVAVAVKAEVGIERHKEKKEMEELRERIAELEAKLALVGDDTGNNVDNFGSGVVH